MALRYSLTVSGVQIVGGAPATPARYVPLDTAPIHITLGGPGGSSQMTFTVEDPKNSGAAGTIALPDGAKVSFTDTVSSTGIAFNGVLLDRDQQPRAVGAGQITAVTCGGLDWYFDHVELTQVLKSKTDTGVRIAKMTNDDTAVLALLQQVGLKSFVSPNSSLIQRTTSGDMDDFNLGIGQTVRSALDELAAAAQPITGAGRNSTRRYYLDADGYLHWYQTNEGLTPPARFADGSYLANLNAASGVVSVWTGRVGTTTTLVDEKNYATATLSGGYTQNVASLCLNEQQLPSVTLNGSTGFATASGANLHPGNTWSVGIVFKRGATQSTAQTLVSAGSGDYLIGFNSSNNLIVQFEGTGDNFVSNATYTSTTLTYHVVVTRSPTGTNGTIVYVNGVAIAGTTTNRVFAAAAGAVNIGRKLSTTNNFFTGTWWGAFVSSSELTSSQVAALFNQWISLTPENLHISTGSADVYKRGYVTGKNAQGSGPFPWGDLDSPPELYPSEFGKGALPDPVAVIDRPNADSVAKQRRAGRAFLAANNSPTKSITFDVTYDPTQVNIAGAQTSLRPGQLIRLTQAQVGLAADAFEVKQVDIDLNMGNGIATFSVTAGALSYSALRRLQLRALISRQ